MTQEWTAQASPNEKGSARTIRIRYYEKADRITIGIIRGQEPKATAFANLTIKQATELQDQLNDAIMVGRSKLESAG